MKIGILLGTFDPIHISHLTAASSVINSKLCDKILFVVAKQNPWKDNKATPFDIRCEMIKASIQHMSNVFEVCELEKDIEPPTYSYKVLEKIKHKFPNDELFIIGGSDVMENITKWYNFKDKIKPYFNFIEVGRGNDFDILLPNNVPFKIIKLERNGIGKINCIIPQNNNISSTMIREMVKNNMNPYPYVNDNVSKIILKNKLYN